MLQKMLVLFTSIFMTIPTSAFGCSYVLLGNEFDHASAQNFDFFPEIRAGIVVNKRNIEKSDGYFDGTPVPSIPAKWISKYGSVSFGLGLEDPVTGVNEAGLSVYRLMLFKTKYPTQTDLPTIQESHFVQQVLDTASTIDEAIALAYSVQIYAKVGSHLVVCDRSAKCAIIEAVDGKIHVYSGSDVKVPALTNTDYPRSLDLLTKCPTGDCGYINSNSEWRFVKAATQVMQFNGNDVVKGTFDILNSVNEIYPDQPMPTNWTLLTHTKGDETKFLVKNTKFSKTIMQLNLKDLDFSCKTPVQVALIDPQDSSDIRFVNYTRDFQETLSEVIHKYIGTSQADKQRRIEYPEQFTRCLDL